jgi:uncharacterized protein (DUF983 family)
MKEATAQVTREPFGIRLQCLCGQEQVYSGVDEHVYACAACHREYQLRQAGADLSIITRTGRPR